MKIQGFQFVHASQSVNGPHRASASVGGTSTLAPEADQLDISPSADLASRSLDTRAAVSRGADAAGIRLDRVAELRAAIQSGNYDTDEKLSVALDRLLDQIG